MIKLGYKLYTEFIIPVSTYSCLALHVGTQGQEIIQSTSYPPELTGGPKGQAVQS